MTKGSLLAGLMCLILFSPLHSSLAQADQDPGSDPVAKLQRAGWKIVQDGVLQRQAKPREIETFVFGVEGFTWKLRDLRNQLQTLRKEFQINPTPELRRAIASHRKAIASTQAMIERARTAEAGGEPILPKTDCTITFAYDAQAAYKTDRQGTWATASASFNSPTGCNFTGEVYAYAFAKTTVGGAPTTDTVTDGPRTGAAVSASADANRDGGPTCESYAFASVTSSDLNPSSYSKSQSNESCPLPLQLSVTSGHPSSMQLSANQCAFLSWTVNVSGGIPPYTATIYRNGVLQTNGTTYSETYCLEGGFQQHSEAILIRAEVTDSSGRFQMEYHVTSINCSESRPCSIPIDG